jgi:hypothetical protein
MNLSVVGHTSAAPCRDPSKRSSKHAQLLNERSVQYEITPKRREMFSLAGSSNQ